MKANKVVFGLMMILVIISGPSVVAQEVDPPRGEGPVGETDPSDPSYEERSMFTTSPPIKGDLEQLKAEKRQVMESLGLLDDLPIMDTFEPPVLTPEDLMGPDLVLPGDPVQEESFPPVLPLEKEDEVREVDENDTRAVNTDSDMIYVATTSGNEWWPSVAHGGNYYMVVYTQDGNIYAKVYSNTGSWLYTHTVADYVGNDLGYPSVAYEANSGLFLVAYELSFSSTDNDIWVQAVSPTTGKIGSTVSAGISLYHEWYPSVACNHISGTCLVAYQHNLNSEIKGMFFTLSSGGISSMSDIYVLTGSTDSYQPYLAWGKDTGYYMLVYTYWDGSRFNPLYNKLYEAPVSSGNQYLYYAAAVDDVNISGSNNKYSSGVAYDPCTQKFVVAFHYDFANNSSDFDVWAVAKLSTNIASGFTPFFVANSYDNERDASISFVTDSHLTPACGSMDKLVVAYLNTNLGIIAADLRGNDSTISPVYTRDSVERHLVVIPKGSMNFLTDFPVAISSGSSRARMFIASEPWRTTSPYDSDIWGRLIEVRERTYIPMTVR